MIGVPAQHQTDPEKAPGQVVTLGDYIQHLTKGQPKKQSFTEWYYENVPVDKSTEAQYLACQAAWYASRANL